MLSEAEHLLLQDLALVCDAPATSDLPDALTAAERDELRSFLESRPPVERVGRYRYRIGERTADFAPAVPLPAPARGAASVAAVALGALGSVPAVLRALNRLERRSLAGRLARLRGREAVD